MAPGRVREAPRDQKLLAGVFHSRTSPGHRLSSEPLLYSARSSRCKRCARFKLSTICPVRTRGTTAIYGYDAEGRRVHENVGGVVKEYVYGATGQELTVVDGNQNLIVGVTCPPPFTQTRV